MSESANERQVGGAHYRSSVQHWDWVATNGYDYFQGQITKYVARWRDKGGIEDLRKAHHFLEKYIELVHTGVVQDPVLGSQMQRSEEKPWALRATLGEISNAAPRAMDDGVNYDRDNHS